MTQYTKARVRMIDQIFLKKGQQWQIACYPTAICTIKGITLDQTRCACTLAFFLLVSLQLLTWACEWATSLFSHSPQARFGLIFDSLFCMPY